MSNAFYRNTSSSAKKNGERERRQNASEGLDEAFEPTADVPVSSDAPRKRGMADQADEPRPERGLLAWNVTVTPSALVTMSVLGVILLGFTFLSGVIVGRGTMPLPQILELETLAPEDKNAQAKAAEKILTEEELRFMTNLKAREAEGVLSAAKTAKPAPKDGKAKAAEKKQSKKAENPAEKQAEKKAEPKQEAKADTAGRFDYELRVAAFQDVAAAQRLGQNLRKEGMRVRLFAAKSGGVLWQYVSVLFRGTAEDLQAQRAKLARFGLRDSMVISKKAVEAKPAKPARKP